MTKELVQKDETDFGSIMDKRPNLDEISNNWARLSQQQAERYERLQQQIAESHNEVIGAQIIM